MKEKSLVRTLRIVVLIAVIVLTPIIVSAEVSNSTYTQSFDTSVQDTNPHGVRFNNDGSKMFVAGSQNNNVYEYSLSTPYDVSSGTYTQQLDVSGQAPTLQGFSFNNDGSKMYVTGKTNDRVSEYTLSTAFDISTASFSQNKDISADVDRPSDVTFNDDGSKMYVTGISWDSVHEYTLSTPFDVSTATISQAYDVSAQAGGPSGVTFNGDGSLMFITDSSSSTIYEYALSTPYDVSTSSLNDQLGVGSEDGGPTGVEINSDGSKMYMSGSVNANIYEYNADISGYDHTVSGIVEDNANNRLEGATVEARNSSGSVIASDTTNANGEYSLSIPDGEYKFIANADSWESESYTLNVSGDVLLDFSLDPILVSGYVRDSTDSGVADASVEFRDGFGAVVKSDTTNATGFYEVQIANGTYEINATKSSYTSDNVTYNVAGSGTVNDLIIESQADVTGYVTDLSGKEVENANVTLYENGVKIESKLTNRNGKFKFNTTNGDYRIEITKKLYAPYSENFSVSGDTDLGKIRIEKKDYDLTLGMSKYMNYSDIQEIVVRFNNNDVTSNSTITITDTYANYELLTYYANNHSLVATHNESLYGEININASYDAGDKIVYVDENVTVSPVEMKHVEILSPLFATLSIVGNQRMQYIFFVIIVGVGATIITTRSGGMGLMIISLIGGWLAGFIGLGVVLASLFAGIFIMMNTQDTLRYGRG